MLTSNDIYSIFQLVSVVSQSQIRYSEATRSCECCGVSSLRLSRLTSQSSTSIISLGKTLSDSIRDPHCNPASVFAVVPQTFSLLGDRKHNHK